MKTSCRDYTLSQSEETSRVRGWILGNTKIDPVLEVKNSFHQGRDHIVVMIESLFRDRNRFLNSHREWNQQIRD